MVTSVKPCRGGVSPPAGRETRPLRLPPENAQIHEKCVGFGVPDKQIRRRRITAHFDWTTPALSGIRVLRMRSFPRLFINPPSFASQNPPPFQRRPTKQQPIAWAPLAKELPVGLRIGILADKSKANNRTSTYYNDFFDLLLTIRNLYCKIEL